MVSHLTSSVSASATGIVADPAARQVLDAIRRIVRSLRESSRASERDLGLSAAQVFVLHRLAGAPALSLNELAQRTLTHQSSVSVVVSKLVKRRLVARVSSTVDARRVEIGLTSRGRSLIEKVPGGAPQDRLIAGLVLIGVRRRRILAAALGELVDAMALSDEEPVMFFEGESVRRRAQGKRGRPATSASRR